MNRVVGLADIPNGASSGDEVSEGDGNRHLRFDSTVRGNRFEELKPLREQERLKAIRDGLIDDPDKPKQLDEALTFVGRIDREFAVKAFHRPAAGLEQALPSDVRPPHILKSTLDYLIESIIGGKHSLEAVHSFVRDRTRSIRQDFTLQNNRGDEAINAHERIARFHILCLHQLCLSKDFSVQQEMEQLRKVLQSLTEFYEDARIEGRNCPNEAEFRAYHVLAHLRDQDIERQAQKLPLHIFQSHNMETAISLFMLAQRNNEPPMGKVANCEAAQNFFTRFFSQVAGTETPYLFACILETQFNEIRKSGLKAMRKAYRPEYKGPSVSKLAQWLGCDGEEDVASVCDYYGIAVERAQGKPYEIAIHKQSSFEESKPPMRQLFSRRIVEAKRGTLGFDAIINGKFGQPQPTKQVLDDLQEMDEELHLGKERREVFSDHLTEAKQAAPATFNFPALSKPFQSIATPPSAVSQYPQSLSPAPSFSFNIPQQIAPPPAVIPAIPQKVEVDYDKEATFIFETLLAGVIKDECTALVFRASNLVLKRRQRTELLDKLASEISTSFVMELTYDPCLQAMASANNQRRSKRRYYRCWRMSYLMHVQQKRTEELQRQLRKDQQIRYLATLDDFTHVGRVRSGKSTNTAVANHMAQNISQAYPQNVSLWNCLDLLDIFSSDDTALLKLGGIWELCLCVGETTSGQWLGAKLGIWSDVEGFQTRYYEFGETDVEIRLYPPETGCENVGAVVYDLNASSDMSYHRQKLAQIVAAITTDSRFSVPILLVDWTNASPEQLSTLLDLEVLSGVPGIANILLLSISDAEEIDLEASLHAMLTYCKVRRSIRKRKRISDITPQTKRHDDYLRRHADDEYLTYLLQAAGNGVHTDPLQLPPPNPIPDNIRHLRESMQSAVDMMSH